MLKKILKYHSYVLAGLMLSATAYGAADCPNVYTTTKYYEGTVNCDATIWLFIENACPERELETYPLSRDVSRTTNSRKYLSDVFSISNGDCVEYGGNYQYVPKTEDVWLGCTGSIPFLESVTTSTRVCDPASGLKLAGNSVPLNSGLVNSQVLAWNFYDRNDSVGVSWTHSDGSVALEYNLQVNGSMNGWTTVGKFASGIKSTNINLNAILQSSVSGLPDSLFPAGSVRANIYFRLRTFSASSTSTSDWKYSGGIGLFYNDWLDKPVYKFPNVWKGKTVKHYSNMGTFRVGWPMDSTYIWPAITYRRHGGGSTTKYLTGYDSDHTFRNLETGTYSIRVEACDYEPEFDDPEMDCKSNGTIMEINVVN